MRCLHFLRENERWEDIIASGEACWLFWLTAETCWIIISIFYKIFYSLNFYLRFTGSSSADSKRLDQKIIFIWKSELTVVNVLLIKLV